MVPIVIEIHTLMNLCNVTTWNSLICTFIEVLSSSPPQEITSRIPNSIDLIQNWHKLPKLSYLQLGFWKKTWQMYKNLCTFQFQIWSNFLWSCFSWLTPYPSVHDFWKIKFEKSSPIYWICNLQKSISKLIFAGYTTQAVKIGLN